MHQSFIMWLSEQKPAYRIGKRLTREKCGKNIAMWQNKVWQKH